jgi:carboxymethylenebutenolidase
MNHRIGASGMTRRAFAALGAAGLLIAAAPSAMAAAPAVQETEVTVPMLNGEAEAILFQPGARGRYPAVILWTDLAGVRPAFRDIGRKLAAAGFVVLLPNSYYRSAKISPVELSAADPETRKKLAAYREAATDDGISRDSMAYISFLDKQKATATNRKAGAVGYDVGGGYAVRTAATQPDRFGAVAVFYGLGVATPRPNSPHLLIPKTKAAYYVAQSKDDDAREPDDKTDIRAKIAEGGLKGVVDVFPADHGWAVPGGRSYDQAAADRALAETTKLLKSALK